MKPGPIAAKIVAALARQQRQKLVDLSVVRKGRDEMRRIIETAIPPDDIAAESPGFAAYVYVTNWALGIVEAIQELPELRRFVDRIEKAEDEYMPSGPPMSPITRSMFWAWALWDLAVGVKRESLGSILLAIVRAQALGSEFAGALEILVESRLGLHVHEGATDNRIRLREMGTDEVRECACPSGYVGSAGELWLARVLPPPIAAGSESIVVTTPCVIEQPGVDAWAAYLDRSARKAGGYERLMKRGLTERHWLEYVVDAYAGHQTEAIFLVGLPDVPETLPHSMANADGESMRLE